MIYQLFTMQQIKDNSHIQGNVSEDLLGVTYNRVQDIYLSDLLGYDMYMDLQTKAMNGTLNPIETSLLNDYILPYISIATEYELVYPLALELRSQTFGGSQDDNIRRASLEEIQAYRDNLRKQALTYRRMIINYICNNSASFPLYRGGSGWNYNFIV